MSTWIIKTNDKLILTTVFKSFQHKFGMMIKILLNNIRSQPQSVWMTVDPWLSSVKFPPKFFRCFLIRLLVHNQIFENLLSV